MIYLDDLAVWVKTQKAHIIRDVVCGAGCLMIVGMFVSANKDGKHLEEVITENKTTLSETNYKLTQANKKISDYNTNSVVKTDTARDVGDAIAEYQTQYGTIISALNNQYSDVDTTNAQLAEVQNSLTDLILDGGDAINPWYQVGDNITTSNYAWEFLTRQATSATVLPSVWQCTQTLTTSGTAAVQNVLSVTFADYDITTKQFSNVKTYQTYNGKDFSENGSSQSMIKELVGSVVPEECWYTDQITEDGTMTYWTQFNMVLNGESGKGNDTTAGDDLSQDASNAASTDASDFEQSDPADNAATGSSGESTDQAGNSTSESSDDSASGSSTRSNSDLLDSVLGGGN